MIRKTYTSQPKIQNFSYSLSTSTPVQWVKPRAKLQDETKEWELNYRVRNNTNFYQCGSGKKMKEKLHLTYSW